MAKKKRSRWVNNSLLLCLFLIPGLFWFFAFNMTMHRAEARQLAEKITGEVIEQREVKYSCKDSDGNTRTCTHWLYQVRFEVDGEQVTRQLLDARFDPDYPEITDGIDHDDYPVGARMPLLLRRDLGNAVTPDSFWSAYMMPVFLAGFGVFVSFFMVIANVLGWEHAPKQTGVVRRG